MSSLTTAAGGAQWPKVLRREFIVRITDKTFLISTGVMVVLIAGSTLLAGLLGDANSKARVIAVSDPASEQVVSQLEEDYSGEDPAAEYTAHYFETDTAAREAVSAGDADISLARVGDTWVIAATSASDSRSDIDVLAAAVGSATLSANAQEAGVDLNQLTAGSVPEVVQLGSDDVPQGSLAELLPLVFALVFYMAVILFGTSIAQSVVSEKESRIVEILAAAVPLRAVLMGKVLATSFLAFLQIALFAGISAVGMAWRGISLEGSSVITSILWFVPFFVIGFLGLACVWAVAGSTASRTEDLQSTSLPLTLGLALVLFAPILLDGHWERVLSYVPIFSSVLMPTRILSGSAEWWEATLALTACLPFCFVTLLLGERMYRRSVMQTNGRVSWFSFLHLTK